LNFEIHLAGETLSKHVAKRWANRGQTTGGEPAFACRPFADSRFTSVRHANNNLSTENNTAEDAANARQIATCRDYRRTYRHFQAAHYYDY
jgi:hypothetical protein